MSTPRTLENILTEYKRAEEVSKRNLDTVSPSTRPAHEAAVRKAKSELPQLRVEYLTAISKSAYGFFVDGDQAKVDKFVEIARENGAFLVDADAIFRELAKRVQPSLGGRKEFSVTQVSLLDYALRELVEATGYEGKLNRISISEVRVTSNEEQLVKYIRELVARTNGSTPSAVYAQSEIVRQAFEAGFTKRNLVVVVKNATQLDRAALHGLFTKTTRVDVDSVAEVDERFAKDSIMGLLKPGYKPQEQAPSQKQPPEPIVPATNPTTTEPQTENQQ